MRKNKKAVSLILSYVILIGISLALSALIYSWMKARAQKPFSEESCPEDVSLVLVSAKCSVEGYTDALNITVQNKGLFNIHGYIIKSSDSEEGIAGKSAFNLYLYGGAVGNNLVDFTYQSDNALVGNERNWTLFRNNTPINQIELEPFIKEEGEIKYCENSITTHRIDC